MGSSIVKQPASNVRVDGSNLVFIQAVGVRGRKTHAVNAGGGRDRLLGERERRVGKER
jgi:hypothetical protein